MFFLFFKHWVLCADCYCVSFLFPLEKGTFLFSFRRISDRVWFAWQCRPLKNRSQTTDFFFLGFLGFYRFL